jgi:two-component system, response regulator YesN
MLKALIVDDEEDIREGLRDIINWERYGFSVEAIAEDGMAALQLYERTKFDLIVTDIKMPRMDGLELAEQIKKIDPHVRILIVSGYDEFSYAKKALKFGIENYLLKPVDTEELEVELTSIRRQCKVAAESPAIQSTDPQRGEDYIEEMIEYIKQHYHEELNLKRLAEHFFLNPYYIGKLIKNKLGCHFNEYIHELRIDAAKRMLQNSTKPINVISEEVGYKFLNHFYKNFKSITGVNPGEFRKTKHDDC